jgi:chromosome segregation ATPase
VAWQQAQENVERLEAELSAATPDDGMIEQLEAMLQEAENEKAFEEGQYQDIVVQGDELDKQAKTQKRSLEDVQRRVGTVNMELGKARTKADQLKNKREEALRNKNEALDQVQAAQHNKTQWEQARGDQQAKIEGVASEAAQICARVEVPEGESHDRLMKKLERVQKQREQNERE